MSKKTYIEKTLEIPGVNIPNTLPQSKNEWFHSSKPCKCDRCKESIVSLMFVLKDLQYILQSAKNGSF